MSIRFMSLWKMHDEVKYDRFKEISGVVRGIVETSDEVMTWDIFGSPDQKLVLFDQTFASTNAQTDLVVTGWPRPTMKSWRPPSR